jgi:peptidoglycan-associated lipoprotein
MKIPNAVKPVLAIAPLALLVACAGQQTEPSTLTHTETNAATQSLVVVQADPQVKQNNNDSIGLSEQPHVTAEVGENGKINNKDSHPATQESESLAMAKILETTPATTNGTHNNRHPDTAKQTLNTSEGDAMTTLVIENSHLFNQQMATMAATSAQQGELFDKSERALPKDEKVFFGFGKNTLNESDIDRIRKAGKYLAKNPQMRVILHGHTDARGQDTYNRNLSVKRAEEVASILTQEGAKASQIEVFGWGSERPLVSNTLYQENRRVEIQFEEVKFAAN